MDEVKFWGELYKVANRTEHTAYVENVISEYSMWHQERDAFVPFTPNREYPTIERLVDEFRRLRVENRRLREGIEMTELTHECEQLRWVTSELEDKLKKKRLKKRGWVRAIKRA